jgi:hypothetical protein
MLYSSAALFVGIGIVPIRPLPDQPGGVSSQKDSRHMTPLAPISRTRNPRFAVDFFLGALAPKETSGSSDESGLPRTTRECTLSHGLCWAGASLIILVVTDRDQAVGFRFFPFNLKVVTDIFVLCCLLLAAIGKGNRALGLLLAKADFPTRP